MAKLLVSVRSGAEALAALAGGADVIDVKEPKNGPLGRATMNVWRDVRDLVPEHIPVSVALGELNDWSPVDSVEMPRGTWLGLAYCKLGLSNASPDWVDRWQDLRERLAEKDSANPAWVAVVYIDWEAARAPAPEAVIEAASAIDACQGVLFDTWDKSGRSAISLEWKPVIERVRGSGRFVALAGSLDAEAITRLAPLQPEIVAVRGAGCMDGDRLGLIDAGQVSILARAVKDHGGKG